MKEFYRYDNGSDDGDQHVLYEQFRRQWKDQIKAVGIVVGEEPLKALLMLMVKAPFERIALIDTGGKSAWLMLPRGVEHPDLYSRKLPGLLNIGTFAGDLNRAEKEGDDDMEYGGEPGFRYVLGWSVFSVEINGVLCPMVMPEYLMATPDWS